MCNHVTGLVRPIVAAAFAITLAIGGITNVQLHATTQETLTDSCPSEGRPIAEIETIVASATPSDGEAVPLSSTDVLQTGRPPDRATADGVFLAALGFHACFAATGQFFALVTDSFIQRMVDDASPESIIEEARTTPTPATANPDRYVAAIGHIQSLEPGRASVVVTLGGVEDSHPTPGRTYLMVFEFVDGQWLLDGMYDQFWNPEAMEEPIWIADLFPPAVPSTDPS